MNNPRDLCSCHLCFLKGQCTVPRKGWLHVPANFLALIIFEQLSSLITNKQTSKFQICCIYEMHNILLKVHFLNAYKHLIITTFRVHISAPYCRMSQTKHFRAMYHSLKSRCPQRVDCYIFCRLPKKIYKSHENSIIRISDVININSIWTLTPYTISKRDQACLLYVTIEQWCSQCEKGERMHLYRIPHLASNTNSSITDPLGSFTTAVTAHANTDSLYHQCQSAWEKPSLHCSSI